MTGPSFREAKKCYFQEPQFILHFTQVCVTTQKICQVKRCVSIVKWQRIIYAQQMSPKDVLKNVLYSTILDKNVKKNAPCMFNFRLLPSKPGSLKILTPPPPPKKKQY